MPEIQKFIEITRLFYGLYESKQNASDSFALLRADRPNETQIQSME